MRFVSTLGMSLVALLSATTAMAQDRDVPVATAYIGASAGYHDLGSDVPGDKGGVIAGGVIGFDVPVSGPVTLGVEGNFHLGTGAIDSEYGAAARLGYRFASGGIAYVRGGWQWVNIDIGNLAGVDLGDDDALGISDTAQDYLVGIGGEFPLGGSNVRLRAGIDTISFDSIRPTAGVILAF